MACLPCMLALLGLEDDAVGPPLTKGVVMLRWGQAKDAWDKLGPKYSRYEAFMQSLATWTDYSLQSASQDSLKTSFDEASAWLNAAQGFAAKDAVAEQLENRVQEQLDYSARVGTLTPAAQQMISQASSQYQQITGKPMQVDYSKMAVVTPRQRSTFSPGLLVVGGLAVAAAWLAFGGRK